MIGKASTYHVLVLNNAHLSTAVSKNHIFAIEVIIGGTSKFLLIAIKLGQIGNTSGDVCGRGA